MSYHPGQICKESGQYKCTNDNSKITVKSGESFPTCKTCNGVGKSTSWVLTQKS
jgi:hypothetical protein